ncbi:MAG: hypothetical protein U0175_20960 [Caldilineaceae bacterium]
MTVPLRRDRILLWEYNCATTARHHHRSERATAPPWRVTTINLSVQLRHHGASPLSI